MSFYLRKSIGLGPMQVSLSTRGIGASVGVPGLRVGAGPRGAYVSLAGGAVTYRAAARRSRGSTSQASSLASTLPPAPLPRPSDVVLSDVTGATTSEMSQTDASDLVEGGALPAPRPAHAPRAQRVVGTDGVVMVARQRLRIGRAHAGKTITVIAEDTSFRVLDGDRELSSFARDPNKPHTRFEAWSHAATTRMS